jgi:hypothetical protein
MQPSGHDARLIGLPDGVQVMRNGRIRYWYYNRISRESQIRLWMLMNRGSQLAGYSTVYIWQAKQIRHCARSGQSHAMPD